MTVKYSLLMRILPITQRLGVTEGREICDAAAIEISCYGRIVGTGGGEGFGCHLFPLFQRTSVSRLQ